MRGVKLVWQIATEKLFCDLQVEQCPLIVPPVLYSCTFLPLVSCAFVHLASCTSVHVASCTFVHVALWQHEECLLHRPHLSLWAKQAASAGGDDDSSLSSENMGRRNGVVADKEMLSVK